MIMNDEHGAQMYNTYATLVFENMIDYLSEEQGEKNTVNSLKKLSKKAEKEVTFKSERLKKFGEWLVYYINAIITTITKSSNDKNFKSWLNKDVESILKWKEYMGLYDDKLSKSSTAFDEKLKEVVKLLGIKKLQALKANVKANAKKQKEEDDEKEKRDREIEEAQEKDEESDDDLS